VTAANRPDEGCYGTDLHLVPARRLRRGSRPAPGHAAWTPGTPRRLPGQRVHRTRRHLASAAPGGGGEIRSRRRPDRARLDTGGEL